MIQGSTDKELGQRIKDLEQKLHQMETYENQYRYLVDSTSDSLYLVDEEGRYLFINENHLQRLNLPAEKIIGYSYMIFIPLNKAGTLPKKLNRYLLPGNQFKTNIIIRTKPNTFCEHSVR